ncbi:MAG: M48 family metallopeptidase [Planctomycetota bacterium]
MHDALPTTRFRFRFFAVARVWLPLVIVLAGVPTLTGCVTNPATGKRVFNTMSEAKEIEIGTAAAPEFINTNGGNIPDEQLLAYVRNLGQELAAVSERPALPWEFHVLDSAQINAFALPGGKVFMSRGLMERMTNEAQLAGVLGHEIGHVTSMHVGRRISQSQAIGVLGIGLSIAGGASDNDWLRGAGIGVMAGGTLVYLPSYSRGNESEADALGVRYMTRLGYNPYGQVEVMEILKEASGGRSGNLLENMLSTHPLPQDRIDDLDQLIRQQYPEAGSIGTYEFREDAFQRNVLARLERLPDPKHNPGAAAKAAILRSYAEHMLAGGGCGACEHQDPSHGS